MIRNITLKWLLIAMVLGSRTIYATDKDEGRIFEGLLGQIAYYFLGDIRAQYANHPHTTQVAQVDFSNQCSVQEQAFVAQKLVYAQRALGTLLSSTVALQAVPRIAVCGSGGGYRAMLNTLGALHGMQEIGLYPAITYAAGVSGSTWALAPLVQAGKSPSELLAVVSDALAGGLLSGYNRAQVEAALLKQLAFSKKFSWVDFYGALLAQKLLTTTTTSDPNAITLAQQERVMNPAQSFFPIESAVIDCHNNVYDWVEFTPYEVYSQYLGASIPPWSFGRKFNAGISTDFVPAQTLGFCMGIWGSSFTADAQDVAQDFLEQTQSSLLEYLFTKIVNDLPTALTDQRILLPVAIPNWTHNIEGSLLNQDTYLNLSDAGLYCDLPFIPLLRPRRALDIIIVIDADEESDAADLRIIEAYAKKNNIPFPPIDYTQIGLPCSVHADWENPAAPVIMYFPLIAQAGYQNGWNPAQYDFTSTFNFSYTHDEALLLSGLTHYAVVQNKQRMVDTIAKVVARKTSVITP